MPCTYDERAQAYKGKAIGHVLGRLITLIHALLRQDHEMLSHLAPETSAPEPVPYDPEMHRHHRSGHHQPLRKSYQRIGSSPFSLEGFNVGKKAETTKAQFGEEVSTR